MLGQPAIHLTVPFLSCNVFTRSHTTPQTHSAVKPPLPHLCNQEHALQAPHPPDETPDPDLIELYFEVDHTCRWTMSKAAASEAARPRRAASKTLAANTKPDSGRSGGGVTGTSSTSMPCTTSDPCASCQLHYAKMALLKARRLGPRMHCWFFLVSTAGMQICGMQPKMEAHKLTGALLLSHSCVSSRALACMLMRSPFW